MLSNTIRNIKRVKDLNIIRKNILNFCDEHRAKVKMKPNINKISSFANKVKIPNSIIEDNFKKMIWKKKYNLINDEITLKNTIEQLANLKIERNNESEKEMDFLSSEVILLSDLLPKLYKTKILFNFLLKTHNKNENNIIRMILNNNICILIKIFVNLQNLSLFDNNRYKKIYHKFCHNILIFLMDVNFKDPYHCIFIDIDSLIKTDQNLISQFNEIKNKNNNKTSMDEKIDEKEGNKKNNRDDIIPSNIIKECILSYDNNISNMTIPEVFTLLILNNKLKITDIFYFINPANQNNNDKEFLFHKFDYESKLKILHFSINIIKEYFILENFLQIKTSTNLSYKENLFQILNSNSDKDFNLNYFFNKKWRMIYRTKEYSEEYLENIEQRKNKIKSIFDILFLITNDDKDFLSKMCHAKYETILQYKISLYQLVNDVMKCLYIYSEKEKVFMLSSKIMFDLLSISDGEMINYMVNLFFEHLDYLNNNQNLLKYDQDIDLEKPELYKGYHKLFICFDYLFNYFSYILQSGIHSKNYDLNSYRNYFEKLRTYYLSTFEVLVINLMKKILLKKSFSRYQLIMIYKINKINNSILNKFFIQSQSFNSDLYIFRLPIVLCNSIKNHMKKLFKSSYSEIALNDFKFFIFEIYLLNKYLSPNQIKFIYNHGDYEKINENYNFFITLVEATKICIPLFESDEFDLTLICNKNTINNFKESLTIAYDKINLSKNNQICNVEDKKLIHEAIQKLEKLLIKN